MESLIEQHAAEQHSDGLRRAAVRREVRGPRRSRAPAVRTRVARRLLAVAGRLDPQATVTVLSDRTADPTSAMTSTRRAA